MAKPAVPSVVKRRRGTFRADEAPKREPVLAVEAPEKPEFEHAESGKEWDRMVPELLSAGLLSRIDRSALVLYCQAWGDYCWARRQIKAKGRLTTVHGQRVPNPAYSVQKEATRVIHKAIADFGLSPSARTKIEALPPKAGDPVAEQHFAA